MTFFDVYYGPMSTTIIGMSVPTIKSLIEGSTPIMPQACSVAIRNTNSVQFYVARYCQNLTSFFFHSITVSMTIQWSSSA